MVAGRLDLEHALAGALTEFAGRFGRGSFFTCLATSLPTLTVAENIRLPALLAGSPHAKVREKALDLLRWLGMEGRASHFPSQLSGGEMQRTAIARALINDPAIILADEPTGNLDSKNGAAVVELLAELNRGLGRTVIVATHSPLADPFATSKILLTDGSIVERTGI